MVQDKSIESRRHACRIPNITKLPQFIIAGHAEGDSLIVILMCLMRELFHFYSLSAVTQCGQNISKFNADWLEFYVNLQAISTLIFLFFSNRIFFFLVSDIGQPEGNAQARYDRQ